jgi:membrane-bound lytic murein transglycosylase A
MRRLAAALTALTLAGCATMPPARIVHTAPMHGGGYAATHDVPATPGVSSLANLIGWREEDHLAALSAVRMACQTNHDPAMQKVCAQAAVLASPTDAAAKAFLETHFRPEILSGPGILTAYFAPEYPARHEPDAIFSAPVRGRPDDLVLPDSAYGDLSGRKARQSVNGQLGPYPTRITIELVPPDHALAWMRPEDLFFLQIQGSGGLVFPDGGREKAIYAADNGQTFTPISSLMVKKGLLAPGHGSGEAIHAWLADHRGAEAQAVMNLNPRYVFFNLVSDDGSDPVGAAGTPLPAGRAIAVDPTWHRYGEIYWVDAVSPTLAGAMRTYRRTVVALDTGSAIKGNVRADLYMGRGTQAGVEAGRVRHTLVLVRLVPIG